MSELLDRPPFADRDDRLFRQEMIALTRHHLTGCDEFRRIWPASVPLPETTPIEALPFVHVGVFKHLLLRTGQRSGRVLRSSGTTGSLTSRIALDEESSALQSRSSTAILSDFVGSDPAPLLVVDHAGSLRQRGEISARVAAALSLRPLASEIAFLLAEPGRPESIRWSELAAAADRSPHLRIYGFTSILWQAWKEGVPEAFAPSLRKVRIDFVHSGGWKRLAGEGVTGEELDRLLLAAAGPSSRVLDYYGLVEQVGIVFPLCQAGFRHVPAWADLIVRDPYTLQPLEEGIGMMQFLNVLSLGAPYHSVLTEDLGRMAPGACPCGRQGKRFELLGRVPKAETRGCANV
jgi:hypothetical protein